MLVCPSAIRSTFLEQLHTYRVQNTVAGMADPFSIASAAISLASTVGTTLLKISLFVKDVRGARKDLDAVARELMSLQLCLDALGVDTQRRGVTYPDNIRNQIQQIVVACEINLEQIMRIMIKLQSGRVNHRVQWAWSEKDEVNKIRSSLESQKTALEIALTMGTISILARQHTINVDQGRNLELLLQQTQSVLVSTANIESRMDTLQDIGQDAALIPGIGSAISELRSQVASLAAREHISPTLQPLINISRSYLTYLDSVEPTTVQRAVDVGCEVRETSRPETDRADLSLQYSSKFGICSVCWNKLTSQEEEARVNTFYEKQMQARARWQTQLRDAEAHVIELRDRVSILEKDLEQIVKPKNEAITATVPSTVTAGQRYMSMSTVDSLESESSQVEPVPHLSTHGLDEQVENIPGAFPMLHEQEQENPSDALEPFLVFTPVEKYDRSCIKMVLSQYFPEKFAPLAPTGVGNSTISEAIRKAFKDGFTVPKRTTKYECSFVKSLIVSLATSAALDVFANLREDSISLRQWTSFGLRTLDGDEVLDHHDDPTGGDTMQDIYVVIKEQNLIASTMSHDRRSIYTRPPDPRRGTDTVLLVLWISRLGQDNQAIFQFTRDNLLTHNKQDYSAQLRRHLFELFYAGFTVDNTDDWATFRYLKSVIVSGVRTTPVSAWLTEDEILLRIDRGIFPYDEPADDELLSEYTLVPYKLEVIWPGQDRRAAWESGVES